jgi:hypothetical protein
MPNRILKESIRSSPNLSALSDGGERLFVRLIPSVDDFGRFDGDPEVILAVCFQRRPKSWNVTKVVNALEELSRAPSSADMPLIRRYVVQGRPYIEITKAALHITRRAEKSRYPAYTGENGLPHAIVSDCPQPQANASLNDNDNGNGNVNVTRSRILKGFDRFWKVYPRKRSQGIAEKVWARINPSEELQDRIINAIEQAKNSAEWLKDGGQYIPYPASWLNSKGWEDEHQRPTFVSQQTQGCTAFIERDGS